MRLFAVKSLIYPPTSHARNQNENAISKRDHRDGAPEDTDVLKTEMRANGAADEASRANAKVEDA